MTDAGRERLLVWLLRIVGVAQLFAAFAVIMPSAWMAVIHAGLGLGPLPVAPIIEYLTRSTSALYVTHGAVMLVITTDVRRYRPIVVTLGVVHTLFGATMIGIDRHAGMPLAWLLSEGPVIIAAGLLTLWLVRSVPRTSVSSGRR